MNPDDPALAVVSMRERWASFQGETLTPQEEAYMIEQEVWPDDSASPADVLAAFRAGLNLPKPRQRRDSLPAVETP